MTQFLRDLLASNDKEQPPQVNLMVRELESKNEMVPQRIPNEVSENNVFVVRNYSEDKDMKEICIYLPTFFRFYINELKEVNFIQDRCSCQATIGLQIYYGDLDAHLVDQLLYMAKIGSTMPSPTKDNIQALFHSPSKDRFSAAERRKSLLDLDLEQYQHFNERGYMIKMYLDHQRPIYLAKGQNINVEHKKFEKLIKFAINDKFDFKMNSNIFWFPISQLRVRMGLYLQSILLDHTLAIGQSTEGALVRIMFNLMRTDSSPIIYEEANLGKYQFALSLAKVNLTIKRPEKRRKKRRKTVAIKPFEEEDTDFEAIQEMMGDDEPPLPFQRVKLGFGMYTITGNYIARSFFRFKFLGILVMFNYFTAASFAGRMGRLAFLTVGLFALLPVMQATLPLTTTLVLPEILVILQQINVLLCVVSSYQGRNNDYTKNRYKWQQDPWFITTLILHILSVVITVGQYFYFKCVTEAEFKTPPQVEEERDRKRQTQTKEGIRMVFSTVGTRLVVNDWKNVDCRRHFTHFKGTVFQSWKEFINRPRRTKQKLQIPVEI